MKKIYFLLILSFSTHYIWGQLDSTYQKTSTEESTFKPQILVDAKNSFLQMMSAEKRVFRFGLTSMSTPLNPQYPHIGTLPLAETLFASFEQRLKTGFSIVGTFNYVNAVNFRYIIPVTLEDFGIYGSKSHTIGLTLAPRWYFNKQKEITEQKSSDNFNGWYAGLSIGFQKWWRPVNLFGGADGYFHAFNLTGNSQFGTIDIGWQRRFKRRAFFSFQLGTGILRTQRTTTEVQIPGRTVQLVTLPKWQWISNYSVGLGWAFGGRIDGQFDNTVWEYKVNDPDMWKVDIFSLFKSLGKDGIAGKLSLGYERRINDSPFSINTNLFYVNSISPKVNFLRDKFIFQIAPRYYYNLKKRMRKHGTANDLSASYLSIRQQWGIDNSNPYFIYDFGFKSGPKYSIQLIWGTQQRIFERMYLDYQIIYDFQDYHYFGSTEISTNVGVGQFRTDLKIGFAF